MIRPLVFIALVGGIALAAAGCTADQSLSNADLDARSTPMPVPEHAVYYLEIVTPDPRAASEFYANAYGWRFEPEAPELGNAFVATLPGGSLCGIRGPLRETEQPIVRTYMRVADIDAAVERAAELGATIALGATELPGRGRIAIYILGGIEQGIWQI